MTAKQIIKAIDDRIDAHEHLAALHLSKEQEAMIQGEYYDVKIERELWNLNRCAAYTLKDLKKEITRKEGN